MKKTARSLFFAGVAIFLIAIVSIVGARYLSQSSTEDRSKASVSNAATFTTEQSETKDEVTVNVYADLSQLQDTQIRQFAVTVDIATQSSVLGTNTTRAHISHSPLEDQKEEAILKNRSSATSTPTPKGTKVCFSDVKVNGAQLSWSTNCKGDASQKNCGAQSVPLTNEEQLMYQAWVDLGKSQKTQCLFAKGASVETVPRFRQTNAVANPAVVAQNAPTASPVATAAPTPTPVPVLLITSGNMSVYKSGVDTFTYSAPVVAQATQGSTITLSGKVENSTQQSHLNGKILIAQIKIKKSSPDQEIVAVLKTQSMKGVRNIAPGVEVELLEKPEVSQPGSIPSPTPAQ